MTRHIPSPPATRRAALVIAALSITFALLATTDVTAEAKPAQSPGVEATPARTRTYFTEYGGSMLARQRPSWIHGGSDFGWSKLTWRTWGGRRALGKGRYYWVEKAYRQPNVAHYYPINIALDTRRRCGSNHQLRYLRMVEVFTGEIPNYGSKRQVTRLTCAGGRYG